HNQLAVFPRGDSNENLRFGWRVFDCVVYQVYYRLPKNQPISRDNQCRVTFYRNSLLFFFSQHLDQGTCFLRETEQRNIRSLHLNVASVGARERKQTIDQACQPVGFLQHAANYVSVLSRRFRNLEGNFANTSNCREWGPQFVGGICCEPP